MKKANCSPRQIDNILALFEANASGRDHAATIKHQRQPTKEASAAKGSLKKRIQAFERAQYESSTQKPRRSKKVGGSPSDWDVLDFGTLHSRKQTLLESLALDDDKIVPSRNEARGFGFMCRTPVRQCKQLQRRASTGRVRFGEQKNNIHTMWKCYNDEYATQMRTRVTGDVENEKKDETRGEGLQRRHSTGCMGEFQAKPGETGEFWHVYEQDENTECHNPMRKAFTRKRTVTFAQHVTVFVFNKGNASKSDAANNLPQEFVHRLSPGKKDSVSAKRKKKMSEDRFCLNEVTTRSHAPPSMPSRRSFTLRSNKNRVSSTLEMTTRDQAPTMPIRNMSSRGSLSPRLPQRHRTMDNVGPTRQQINREKASQSSFNKTREQSIEYACMGSHKEPERQPIHHNPSYCSPTKPQRRLSLEHTPSSSTKPVRKAGHSNLMGEPHVTQLSDNSDNAVPAFFSTNRAERESTVFDKSAPSPVKTPRRVTQHGVGDLHGKSFHESRGSNASEKIMIVDSLCECSATLDTTDDSDIPSIDSEMLSSSDDDSHERPGDRYLVTAVKPNLNTARPGKDDEASQDSEETRRARVLMWFYRFAMPSYDTMKRHVRVTPGLGITLDDVDLLPWSKTNAIYKRR